MEKTGRPNTQNKLYKSLPQTQQNSIKQYIDDLKGRKYSDQTTRQYKFYLTHLLANTQQDVDKLQLKDLKAFLGEISTKGLNNKPIKHTSLRAIYSCYNSFFKYHGRTDLMQERQQVKGVPDEEIEIISQKERDELFDRALTKYGHKYWAIFSTGYWAALRVSELINLKVKDVDFNRKKVYIVEGKGNKNASVELLPPLEKTLKKYMDSTDFNEKQLYMFEYKYKKGEHANTSWKFYLHRIENVFQDLLADMGMTRIMGFHTLRHSCASHLLLATNGDIDRVRKHLRHKRGSPVTLRYVHANSEGITDSELEAML